MEARTITDGCVLIDAPRNLHRTHLDAIPRNRTAITFWLRCSPESNQWLYTRLAQELVNGHEAEFSLLMQSQLIPDPPRAFVLGTQSEDRRSIDLRNLLA